MYYPIVKHPLLFMYKFALFAKVIFMGGVYKGELHVYPKDWN